NWMRDMRRQRSKAKLPGSFPKWYRGEQLPHPIKITSRKCSTNCACAKRLYSPAKWYSVLLSCGMGTVNLLKNVNKPDCCEIGIARPISAVLAFGNYRSRNHTDWRSHYTPTQKPHVLDWISPAWLVPSTGSLQERTPPQQPWTPH